METNRSTTGSKVRQAHWPGYIQFMVVAVLTILFVLLALSMERHHFFSGNQYNHRSNSSTP